MRTQSICVERENEKIDDVGYVCGVDDAKNSVTFTATPKTLRLPTEAKDAMGFLARFLNEDVLVGELRSGKK